MTATSSPLTTADLATEGGLGSAVVAALLKAGVQQLRLEQLTRLGGTRCL